MSITGHNNLSIGRGEIKAHIFTVDNPPPGGLSGLSFRLYIYGPASGVTALLAKTAGFTVIEDAVVEMAWDAADTAGLAPGVYSYVLLEAAQNLCLSFGALTVRHGVPTTVTSSVPTPFGLVYGGTGSDLSATGPGFVRQASTGASFTVSAFTLADIPQAGATGGQVLAWNGSAWAPATVSGTGTVTSVDGSGGATGLTFSGGPITGSGTLTLAGTLALASGGTGASLADPGADRLLFWDDSADAVTWLTIGSGLSITGTTLTSTGGSSSTDIDFRGVFLGMGG